MFKAIGEYLRKSIEEGYPHVRDLVLENLPQAVDAAGKVLKEATKNAQSFLK